VNPAEVVVGEVDRNRVLVVRKLLRERIGKAGEPAIGHGDRDVLARQKP
jgi:hypothetical protein